jgi:hypothetical protein
MGMFDYIRCELPMPDGREVQDTFQSKSLWCCMDQFTITAAGRLIHHPHEFKVASSGGRVASAQPVHVADIDMDYHGDLVIHGTANDRASVCYTVRFTHGQVEWIRLFETLPEINRRWLLERGQ